MGQDAITFEFTETLLTRRWVHSNAVDEPVGFEEYVNTSGVGSGLERTMFARRQGSVLWVADPATGDVVAGYEYDAYGQITQVAGSSVQPYGYTGREYDPESGLYYYRARNYDPTTGTFVQIDPIEVGSGTLSLYSYVDQNPMNFIDPKGLTGSASFTQTAGYGAVLGGVAVGGVQIGNFLRAARTITFASRQIGVLESSWWDDVYGEEASGLRARIERLEKEREECHDTKWDMDTLCSDEAARLRSNGAQVWHVRERSAICQARNQRFLEECLEPIDRLLQQLRSQLRNIP